MKKIAKAVVAAIATGIAAAVPLVGDGVSLRDALVIAGAALAGGFPTWAVPNAEQE